MNAEELRTLAAKAIEHARNNSDISQEKKARLIARAYIDLKDGLEAIETGHAKQESTRRAQLERKLYGIPNHADANSMISYRDALDRAGQIPDDNNGEAAAIALLNRAQTSGDELLVRAVLATGYERQWVDVINTHINQNPNIDGDANELWTLQQNQASAFSFEHVATPPREISNYGETTLRTMAADEAPLESIASFN